MNSKFKTILNLLIIVMSSLSMVAQDTGLFKSGFAEVNGVIEDYDPETCPQDLLVYIDNNLICESAPKTIPIAEDGSFSIAPYLVAPGYQRFSGNHCYFDLFLEPDRTLEVRFKWQDVVRYNNALRRGEEVADCPFSFGGDSGSINKELYGFQGEDHFSAYQIAHDQTPSEAFRTITDNYEKKRIALKDYCEGNKLDSIAKKVLAADIKCKYMYDIFAYDSARGYNQYSDTLAPSLRESLELSYFEPMKDFISEDDKWVLSSRYVHGLANNMAVGSLHELLGYKNSYILNSKPNALTYLKSIGASLTPEEEQAEQWLDEHDGKAGCYDEGWRKISMAADVAERNGLKDKFIEFFNQIGPQKVKYDVASNLRNSNLLIKDYLDIDYVPLMWQVMQAGALRWRHMFDSDHFNQEEIFNMLSEIRSDGDFSFSEILDAIEDYYRGVFAMKSFEIPDDERGKVIRDIIAPYEGKMLLLDFWATWCGSCCQNIKNSLESREKNRNQPDFKYIFISPNDGSEERYDGFVEKYLEGETCVRIPESDFSKMRDLFNFSGIPHYVLIGSDGNVLDSDVNNFYLNKTLEKYGVKLE